MRPGLRASRALDQRADCFKPGRGPVPVDTVCERTIRALRARRGTSEFVFSAAAAEALAVRSICDAAKSESVMILPQVHLRKPCYDFYFL